MFLRKQTKKITDIMRGNLREIKAQAASKPGDHQDVMISLGSDRTTSSLQGSEITCESDR